MLLTALLKSACLKAVVQNLIECYELHISWQPCLVLLGLTAKLKRLPVAAAFNHAHTTMRAFK